MSKSKRFIVAVFWMVCSLYSWGRSWLTWIGCNKIVGLF